MVILALSDGAWATVGLSITQFGALFALILQNRRNGRKLNEVGRAVNNVPPGRPTLVQRVERLEEMGQRRDDYLVQALTILADQLGVKLPPPPNQEERAA